MSRSASGISPYAGGHCRRRSGRAAITVAACAAVLGLWVLWRGSAGAGDLAILARRVPLPPGRRIRIDWIDNDRIFARGADFLVLRVPAGQEDRQWTPATEADCAKLAAVIHHYTRGTAPRPGLHDAAGLAAIPSSSGYTITDDFGAARTRDGSSYVRVALVGRTSPLPGPLGTLITRLTGGPRPAWAFWTGRTKETRPRLLGEVRVRAKGAASPLSSMSMRGSLCWSPDGRRFAFCLDGSLWVVRVSE